MKILKASLAAAMAGVSVVGLTLAAPAHTQAQSAATVPVEVWALRDVVDAVQISPDGKHLLVHINPSREGEYLLQIYKTDDLTTPYRTLAAKPMEITSARWVSNNYIYGSAWQVVRKNVNGQEEDVRGYQAFFYNLEKNKFERVDGNFGLVNTLPNEPNHILIASGSAVGDLTGSDPIAQFRPRSYYRFDLEKGTRELVMRGTLKFPQATFDNEGNPRFAVSSDPEGNTLTFYYRKPGESNWTAFREVDQSGLDAVPYVLTNVAGIKAFDPDNPNIGYLVDWLDGEDKAGLYEFDFAAGKVGKKLFQAENADVLGVQLHSIPGNDRLVAAVYPGEKLERHWFDEEEKALYEALEQQIPNAHQISIASRSLDGRSMVVTNSGPRDPGSFWLVKDGKLAKLGSRNPLLNPDQLSDVKFVRYPSRDGKSMVPGYVTIPKGTPPFPLVVMPHGGPAVPEIVGYDEWGQMLASRGYMVLQPGYRHTVGWGKQHFMGGLGEFGGAMQDDKDDGALYLVEQGLADPDRMAMFGWSYGGYAALVAVSRDPNIYQCTVAGAAVANYQPWKNYLSARAPGALKAWLDNAYGVNPIAEAPKANIPLLMMHPRQDRRVLYYHFKDYKQAFDAAGKTGEFITIEGADHFYNTHLYEHQQQIYTKLLDYLANDCGPGGL